MTVVRKELFKASFAGLVLAIAAGYAHAVDVAGIKYDDSMAVAGSQLLLNGVGTRNKSVVKVYAAGLYLKAQANTVDGVMKADGPRRMRLVMLIDIPSEDLGTSFMTALSANVSESDKAKIVTQVSKYGEMFGQIGSLKKGDTIDTDWIPGVGNQCYLNGKKFGPVIPDVLFYNSLLRIWLGNKPVDAMLKTKLLEPVARK